MKHYLKYIIITLFIAAGLSACKKGEPLHSAVITPVSLSLQGLILDDTLEFVVKDKVVCTAFDNSFIMKGNLFTAGAEMIIRKKKDGKKIGQFKIDASPYYQTKKIFFVDNGIVDKIILNPVSNPDNMGFKVRFQTTFPGFYGGPVDIQIYDQLYDPNTFEYFGDNTPIRLIRNVTTSFDEFIELSLPNTDVIAHFITFKVYKAGTTQLPFTDDVVIGDPDTYGGILHYDQGKTELITIAPAIDANGKLGEAYEAYNATTTFSQ